MDAGVPRFPFLRLPEDVRMETVRQMSMMEILNFSLSSKQTKSTVRKLNIDIDDFEVHINERIHIIVDAKHRVYLTFDSLNDMTPEFDCPYDDSGSLDVSPFIANPGFRFEQWLNHLLYIFNQRQIKTIEFNGFACAQLLLNFRRTFDKFDTLSIYHRCPDHVAQEVLNKFRPDNTLWIDKYVPDINNNLTSENLNTIRMITILKLDQLLIMNSKLIVILTPKFSSRDMNRFLKLWIAGSNRNLAILCIRFENPTVLEMNQVIKGISHEKVSNDVRRTFSDFRKKAFNWVVNGGIDIRRRRDGAIATIEIVDNNEVFNMFVWP